MKTIFVQIASYRDPECQWTVKDLFEKAKYPQRITVGICWQYDPDTDGDCFELSVPAEQENRIRIAPFHWTESRGVCWARHQTQLLYEGEDYTLAIDSHMRFVKDWDEKMIAALAECASPKPVLSNHPASYTPPATLEVGALPSVLHATEFSQQGNIRMRGRPLSRKPPKPLKGAFVSPGFMFSAGSVIQEIPYDPVLYFEQEELSLAARLFTHGWDVYSPKDILIYHYYTPVAGAKPRPMHWDDQPMWGVLNDRANARLQHLLGMEISADREALHEIEKYGLGDARTLEEFAAFSGIDFEHRHVGKRALDCGFIENLHLYMDGMAKAPAQKPAPPKIVGGAKMQPKVKAKASRAAISPPPVSNPFTTNEAAFARLERDNYNRHPLHIDRNAPQEVLVIYDYIDRATCDRLARYADAQTYTELDVVDPTKSTKDVLVTQKDEGRITHHVHIDGMAYEILTIFNDIYCKRLASFYNVDFEWYERPQILRYPAGGKYNQHADADHWVADEDKWVRVQDRDYSVLLYLNDEYEGGEIQLINQDYTVKPKPGMLLAFPADYRFLHAALPTTSGIRYVIVSWAAIVGSKRVRPQMPYASVFVRQKREA
jgi:hypothetical protein